jgi:hypothetical protein
VDVKSASVVDFAQSRFRKGTPADTAAPFHEEEIQMGGGELFGGCQACGARADNHNTGRQRAGAGFGAKTGRCARQKMAASEPHSLISRFQNDFSATIVDSWSTGL